MTFPEVWFRNALTFEIVILMSHHGTAGNHRFLLFFVGECYKPLARTKYGFPCKIVCFVNYDVTDFLD